MTAGTRERRQDERTGPSGRRSPRLSGPASTAAIGASLTVIAMIGLLGPSAAVVTTDHDPSLPGPALGEMGTTLVLAAALALGACGLAGGVMAVGRGWTPDPRRLLAGGLVAALALALLPAMGSHDMLNYAAFGRIANLGHNPFTMSPADLRQSGDPVGRWVTGPWTDTPSVYGPLATLTQTAASALGGASMAWTVAWLKIWNFVMFAVAALVLHHLAGPDAARRLRVHLFWTANPLVLWNLVACGHIEGQAVGFGVIALWTLRVALRPGSPLWPAVACGLALGAAVAVKAPFVLLGIGVAWAARRSPRILAAVGLSAAAVLLTGYLATGPEAITAVLQRSADASWITYWTLFSVAAGAPPPGWMLSYGALAISAGVAALILRSLPRHDQGEERETSVRVGVAVVLGWLLITPVYYPWYEAMLVPLLALWPASRLDELTLWRALLSTLASLPGVVMEFTSPATKQLVILMAGLINPTVLFVVTVAFVGALALRRVRTPGPGA
ncbi:hypothetical protein [Actinomadura chokoriensis]|uniref:DUF2029 domain-containing protein n=1 Tax=Actinomadura chokoriensis TaxID=454156 RepID=A0ABV4QRD0_9ACTN